MTLGRCDRHGTRVVLPDSRYTVAMQVPHSYPSPTVLRAVIAEFVTRDGTDHSAVEPRIEAILQQLRAGSIELHYDEETASCNFVDKADA